MKLEKQCAHLNLQYIYTYSKCMIATKLHIYMLIFSYAFTFCRSILKGALKIWKDPRFVIHSVAFSCMFTTSVYSHYDCIYPQCMSSGVVYRYSNPGHISTSLLATFSSINFGLSHCGSFIDATAGEGHDVEFV